MGARRGALVASITGMLSVPVAFAPSITGATPAAPTGSITLENTVMVDTMSRRFPESTTTDPGTTTTSLVSGGGGDTTTPVPSVTLPGQALPATGASPNRSLWFSLALVSAGLASLMLARGRRTTSSLS